MQLPITSSVTAHGHAVFPFPFPRLLNWHEGRLDGQQRGVAYGVPRTAVCPVPASPTSLFPASGGRVHADHR
jgi:hypothetical protein